MSNPQMSVVGHNIDRYIYICRGVRVKVVKSKKNCWNGICDVHVSFPDSELMNLVSVMCMPAQHK